MTTNDHHAPSFATLAHRTLTTGLDVLRNRSELLVLEAEELKARQLKLIIRGVGALFLGLIGLGAFLWAMKSGQFEDLDGAAARILYDDDPSKDDEAPPPSR